MHAVELAKGLGGLDYLRASSYEVFFSAAFLCTTL